jgi:hypothetical protein
MTRLGRSSTGAINATNGGVLTMATKARRVQGAEKEFSRKADREAKSYIDSHTEELYLPKPPDKLIDCKFRIEVRPLISLTPTPYRNLPFS